MGKVMAVLPDELEEKLREEYVRRKGDISNIITKALKLLLSTEGRE